MPVRSKKDRLADKLKLGKSEPAGGVTAGHVTPAKADSGCLFWWSFRFAVTFIGLFIVWPLLYCHFHNLKALDIYLGMHMILPNFGQNYNTTQMSDRYQAFVLDKNSSDFRNQHEKGNQKARVSFSVCSHSRAHLFYLYMIGYDINTQAVIHTWQKMASRHCIAA